MSNEIIKLKDGALINIKDDADMDLCGVNKVRGDKVVKCI